jgi:lipopolysaccharide export system protein LptA
MVPLISSLRRWFAAGAILAVLTVAGVYFYARHRVQNALKEVPEKMGIEIQQTATGFSVSKSAQGRTLFKLDASKAVQFKAGGQAELHDVTITLYGRDSSRYDRIYGSAFDYNQQTGEARARGEVQIDLEANPGGVLNPDQAPPSKLKTAIHLKTSGLVFDQKSGNAYTKEKVEFQLPQAHGSAVGVSYVAKTDLLTLESNVELQSSGPAFANVTADHAVVLKNPRQVLLDRPQFAMAGRKGSADKAVLFLRADETLGSAFASGNVSIQTIGDRSAEIHANQLELSMTRSNTPQTATFSGAVTGKVSGDQPFLGSAGRVVLHFVGDSQLSKVHAEDGVKLSLRQKPAANSPTAQNVEITASIIDFFLGSESRMQNAETAGPAQITFSPVSADAEQTVVTAGKFQAHFDPLGKLSSVHGDPDARIVSKNAGQPDRVSTSEMLDVDFRDGGRITSIVQNGQVAYQDGERRAWSDRARYTPSDQLLVLNGSPRVIDGGLTTTAKTMRMNRATGDALAEDNVKSTYSDLKAQPDGALLASSSPIHVTAGRMTIHGNAAVALYSGTVRLWQDANMVEAPSIEFDRDHRSMLAHGTQERPVSTVLIQSEKDKPPTPVAITSSVLTYTDDERRAHFEQNVTAKGDDVTVTAQQMDAFLNPRGSANNAPPGGSKLEKLIATQNVTVLQTDREAKGDQLTYTAADDKFVMTGGPPSIFDAEHGKITGVSLTFFRLDGRVLVEGNNSFPTVTQTRVAR